MITVPVTFGAEIERFCYSFIMYVVSCFIIIIVYLLIFYLISVVVVNFYDCRGFGLFSVPCHGNVLILEIYGLHPPSPKKKTLGP